MAVVNQLNLNVGTEQNPNFVLHDINDKRISTTAVTTATHILTCNSGVTSIAPITAANLASVLGVNLVKNDGTPLSELTATGRYYWLNIDGLPSDFPSELIVSSTKAGILEVFVFGSQILQRFTHYRNVIFQRIYSASSWTGWVRVTTTSA